MHYIAGTLDTHGLQNRKNIISCNMQGGVQNIYYT